MDQCTKILDRLTRALQSQGFSDNTEHAFVYWSRAFLEHNSSISPERLGKVEVESFLDYLIHDRFAPAAIQNQALQALLFMFRNALDRPSDWLADMIESRARRGHRNLVSPDDIRELLGQLEGQSWLAAALIYGGGLRLREVVELRVADIDLQQHQITVGLPGQPQRSTLLPRSMDSELGHHLQNRHLIHLRQLAEGHDPNGPGESTSRQIAGKRMPWADQYLFVSSRASRQSGQGREAIMQRMDQSIRKGAIDAGLYQMVNARTLRDSFAMEMLKQGAPKPWLSTLLGISKCETARDSQSELRLHSPLDLAFQDSDANIRVNTGQAISRSSGPGPETAASTEAAR